MKKFYYINLPVKFDRFQVDNFIDDGTSKEIPMELNKVNSEFIDWLHSLGLSMNMGRFFHVLPHHKMRLHIDSKDNGPYKNCVKMNIVFNSVGTIMKWWELKPDKQKMTYVNGVGEIITGYNEEDCYVIDEGIIDQPIIFDGMTIHNLVNGSTLRNCYSLYLTKFETGERITWEEAPNIFKDYIITRE
jgi:hypothetical protein